MKFRMILWITVGYLLTACVPQQLVTTNAADFKTFFVTLDPKPNPAPGELEVKKGPQGWENGNKKDGYVGFDVGQSGAIIFALKKEETDDTCPSAGLGGDAQWVISKIELSATPDDSNPPVPEKGKFPSTPDAWLSEAFPGVNTTNGQVFPAAVGGFGNTTVVVQNANNQEGYKFIYYQVTASPCGGGLPVVTDPGVGNGGRK